MQSFSPTSRYQQALNDGSHQPDNVQLEAVNRLETIFQALTTPARPAPQESGLMARFGNSPGKRESPINAPVCGLYMWGGVGRGKTWLMDPLTHSLPGERKQRLHFHRFNAARA